MPQSTVALDQALSGGMFAAECHSPLMYQSSQAYCRLTDCPESLSTSADLSTTDKRIGRLPKLVDMPHFVIEKMLRRSS